MIISVTIGNETREVEFNQPLLSHSEIWQSVTKIAFASKGKGGKVWPVKLQLDKSGNVKMNGYYILSKCDGIIVGWATEQDKGKSKHNAVR